MSNFLRRVESNCAAYKDRIAFEDNRRSITFNELWNESGKVFTWLKKQGMKKEDFCQIVLPKSASSMAALLGVLRSGCAFCNLDSAYPPERIAYTRADLNAKCVIDEVTYAKIQKEEEPSEGYVKADPHDAVCPVIRRHVRQFLFADG